MINNKIELLKIIISGFFNMALVIGISRFAYTAILPIMQDDFHFNHIVAGSIASANYFGYFSGAVMFFFVNIEKRQFWFRVNLVATLLSTVMMAFSQNHYHWMFIRYISGFTSAVAFVLGSAIVLESLVKLKSIHYKGIVYSGVGFGIMITSLTIIFFDGYYDSNALWLMLSIVSLVFFVICWMWIVEKSEEYPVKKKNITKKDISEAFNSHPALKFLVIVYFLEGLGYIISGTFLVSMAKTVLASSLSANIVWFIVGLSVIVFSFLWYKLIKVFGYFKGITLAYLVQSIGMILPVIHPGEISFYISAVSFGGTFMAIVHLTLTISQKLSPGKSHFVIAGVTAAFGLGQIIGPSLAGFIAEQYSLLMTLVLAFAIIFIAFISLVYCYYVVLKSEISFNDGK